MAIAGGGRTADVGGQGGGRAQAGQQRGGGTERDLDRILPVIHGRTGQAVPGQRAGGGVSGPDDHRPQLRELAARSAARCQRLGSGPGPDRPRNPAVRVQLGRPAVEHRTRAVGQVPGRPDPVARLHPLQEAEDPVGHRRVPCLGQRHRDPARVTRPGVVPAGAPAGHDGAIRPDIQPQVEQRPGGHGSPGCGVTGNSPGPQPFAVGLCRDRGAGRLVQGRPG